MELIRLDNVAKTYRLGEVDVPALRGVSLSIERGELVALMGASGSGKSTLMNILGCLDRPTSGQYWFAGQDMSRLAANERALVRSEKLGIVFQNFNLLARTSAMDNVLMPLDYAARPPSASEARRFAHSLLERVGLAQRVHHEPSQMSGGQQQRVAIGRSLINRPLLLLADEPTGNLDSQTSAEILRMFQDLNAEGITVILVTHDPDVANYTDRTIRIHDGQVASDQRRASRARPPGANAAAPSAPSTAGTAGAAGESRNSPPPSTPLSQRFSRLLPPTLRTAVGSLRRNKMRSTLTTLGIIIGVAAVIAMMEISDGSKAALQSAIASMGANNLQIQPGAATSGGISFGSGTVVTLSPQDAEAIAQQCPAVRAVAPILLARSQIVYGPRNWVPMFIFGTTPAWGDVRDWDLEQGTMFTDQEVRSSARVCVVGATVADELFQGESAVGEDIRIQNVTFRVIGVLCRKGANMVGMDQDDVVVAPWTSIKYRVSGSALGSVNQSSATTSTDSTNRINSLSNLYPGSTALYPTASAAQQADTPQPVRYTNVDMILVRVASAEEIPQAMTQITELLRDQHRIRPGDPDDFSLRDMTEITQALSQTSRLMGVLLLIVALISLVVGGVGIMNIMLVSVTERTREIGLRMAVGARTHHILWQFLVEAVVLCLFGGALGIALGRGASTLVEMLLHWAIETSWPAIFAAVAVSATVGILFGFYPAWRASRLDPIEALRYE